MQARSVRYFLPRGRDATTVQHSCNFRISAFLIIPPGGIPPHGVNYLPFTIYYITISIVYPLPFTFYPFLPPINQNSLFRIPSFELFVVPGQPFVSSLLYSKKQLLSAVYKKETHNYVGQHFQPYHI